MTFRDVMASDGVTDLSEWKNNVERQVAEITQVKLFEKIKVMEEKWRYFKKIVAVSCSDGFVNPVMHDDDALKHPAFDDALDPRNTGPIPQIPRLQSHTSTLNRLSHSEELLECLKANTQDLQNMAFTIRLHISLLAPPKRTAENLEAAVQQEIGTRIDTAISFCQQFLAVIEQFSRSRGNSIAQISKTYDLPDADQSLYEYDQALSMSLSRGFLELQYIFYYLADLIEVRFIILHSDTYHFLPFILTHEH